MEKIPQTFKKIVATKFTTQFDEAAAVVEGSPLKPLGDNDVIIKNKYVGINATDVNSSNGLYSPGVAVPFDLGFEAIGEVIAVGKNVTTVRPGEPVFAFGLGAYAEYWIAPIDKVTPLPAANADFLALGGSGRTADISFLNHGNLKAGLTVLVTAAAGGTGHLAVQFAKAAGCHVIGTCSSDEKMELLKGIGCDRPINYKKENLGDVLRKEYSNGINVVYECVGGEMFDIAVEFIAIRGTIIQIGCVSSYQSEHSSKGMPELPWTLVCKSAIVAGFFLFFFENQFEESFVRQLKLYNDGKIKVHMDNGKDSPGGVFKGIDSVKRALQHLYSKQSMGKIFVEL